MDSGTARTAPLRGPGVALRPATAADVIPLWEAVRESEDQLTRWMAWCHEGYDRDEAARWVERCQEGARPAGAVRVPDRRPRRRPGPRRLRPEPARLAEPAGQPRVLGAHDGLRAGLATTATGLLADYGFAELGLVRAEIIAATGNAASQRVAVKAGATREGVLRNRLWLHGRPQDAMGYSLTPGG